ncbi:hypothetical protein [Patiriisocius sp. Uisw_047]|jgi:hypothetical protein|uniref:hypothetical protein n=1 Tax=Patiriisocius sp. Uisw_047 TaxID=3230969 RepID=UPI0039E80069|tara:strand:+ start:234 stop:758 length:525 start_codon:yes stop_codon:yes gene_type:complete
MNKQKFLIIIIFFSLIYNTYGQDRNWQIGLKGDFIPAGSELNNSYSTLVGVEANYFFKNKDKLRYYGTTGFSTDVDGSGSSITLIDLGVGVYYNLFNIKDRPFYTTLNVGGLYAHEKFSTQLIEGTIQSTFNEFGYTANLGVGYYIFKNINVQLNVNQLNNLGTTLGLSIYYNF